MNDKLRLQSPIIHKLHKQVFGDSLGRMFSKPCPCQRCIPSERDLELYWTSRQHKGFMKSKQKGFIYETFMDIMEVKALCELGSL